MADDAIQVEVVGLDELVTGAEDLAKRIGHSAGPAMEKGAGRAAELVRGSVPRLTGALASSVTTGSDHEGQGYLGMGEGLPYAGWIEYGGTRGRAYVDAGRYLYPAAVAAEPALVVAASDQAKQEIGGYPWRTPKR